MHVNFPSEEFSDLSLSGVVEIVELLGRINFLSQSVFRVESCCEEAKPPRRAVATVEVEKDFCAI